MERYSMLMDLVTIVKTTILLKATYRINPKYLPHSS